MFRIVLINVALMLAYMTCGFVLVKWRKAVSDHGKSLSAILVYILSPCLIISSFQTLESSLENIINAGLFFLISLIIQILFFTILYLLLRKKYDDAKYRILTAGALLGNCGFFGYPLITALFPEFPIVGCYSAVFIVSMNLLVFTVGVFLITRDSKYISIKSAILNPTMAGAAIAIPLYLLNFHFSTTVGNSINLLGKMCTPVCMFVLGMRLASMSFKQTFCSPFAYVVCLLKLLVFPFFAFACVYFLPFVDETFKVSMFVLCATPSAAVVLNLAELYGKEQKLSANVVLLTTICSLVTLPLLMLLFK